ncbi:glycosyl hydrolase 115 family protein [Arachidicoccus terrestris]|uniref:glycosyl hydrolase 115 family protein n=1 Tax=Arachidicoccus terrestris TaxID=2875539 RepID=UPI001CC3424A|nr:glycosyl hydrolase 115 family protein [Arachidicoccus terrestris]UAY57044.1 glycosyl hydrolase 115 family protein [Arachidicoccus terrestris]
MKHERVRTKTLKVCFLVLTVAGGFLTTLKAQKQMISFSMKSVQGDGAFVLADNSRVTPIMISADDWKGVAIASENLSQDFKRVTGIAAPLMHGIETPGNNEYAIIAGTIGHSTLIDGLIRRGVIKVSDVGGKWESTLMQVVEAPLPGIKKALVIAGSDKRGTIYGIYELSRQIGVSPWYYWADVPVVQHDRIYCLEGSQVLPSPKVKYRGIFLNDEAPALSGWVHEQFGGFNHKFYTKVFELLLRLKANYLWPAMWGNAFNDDDTLNPVLADQYGIVMGTSHHEPMLRAQQEWKRYGKGAWNYQENKRVLQDFWKKGIEHMGTHESIVTIGMRGDGDMPMTEGSNIALLENIVKDQRTILEEVTGKPAAKTPQLWALYKEVQDYYDKGMRVPDDVTLLLCDDNWGNLRRLPRLDDTYRSGGYGIYYHFDYVGGPRNYKWINTNTIERTWEQMHMAYAYGANQIWIVNVGDLKPMEFPISFFLDYARNPDQMGYSDLPAYTVQWSRQQFGDLFAEPIANIIHLYTKYNARVKPELLDSKTYSLKNYDEWNLVVRDYNALAAKSNALYDNLPEAYKAAYFELVDYQVAASANLYKLYRAQALNHLYASQHRSTTNKYADSVLYYYKVDSLLSHRYNKVNAGGKWNHFMDQTHIGYTYWQQPEHNSVPAVQQIHLDNKAILGIATPDTLFLEEGVEGATGYGRQGVISIFAKGAQPVKYMLKASANYLKISQNKGMVSPEMDDLKVTLSVDWKKINQIKGNIPTAFVQIKGADGTFKRICVILRPELINDLPHQAFIQSGDIVSIDALGFAGDSSKIGQGIRWVALPGFGKTNGAVTPMPVTFKELKLDGKNPNICYRFFTRDEGAAKLCFYLSPTLNIWNNDGLKFAYSIDDGQPEIVNINKGSESIPTWRKEVAASIKKISQAVQLSRRGLHTLKIWAISPGVVLQKMVLDFGMEKQSFLGAPVSYFNP